MAGDYVYHFSAYLGTERKLSAYRETERKRAKRARRFYHVSPFAIRPNQHIRPRWSAYQLWAGTPDFAVYLLTSLLRAQRLARSIYMDFLQGGVGGYGGTTYDEPGELRHIRGLWIYRVQPTGPLIHSCGPDELTTPFAVRVLEVADRYREPEKNRCRAPGAMTDRDAARLFDEGKRSFDSLASFERLWGLFRASHREDREIHRSAFLAALDLEETSGHWDKRDRNNMLRVFDSFHKSKDKTQARLHLDGLKRQEEMRIAEEMAHLRHKEHRKLRQDKRYRRRRFRVTDEDS